MKLVCYCDTETIKKSKSIYYCDFCNKTFIMNYKTGEVSIIKNNHHFFKTNKDLEAIEKKILSKLSNKHKHLNKAFEKRIKVLNECV